MVKPKLVKVHAPIDFYTVSQEGSKYVNSPKIKEFKDSLETFASDFCNSIVENDENVKSMLTDVANKEVSSADDDQWWDAYDEIEGQFIQGCTTELLKKIIK